MLTKCHFPTIPVVYPTSLSPSAIVVSLCGKPINNLQMKEWGDNLYLPSQKDQIRQDIYQNASGTAQLTEQLYSRVTNNFTT